MIEFHNSLVSRNDITSNFYSHSLFFITMKSYEGHINFPSNSKVFTLAD